MKYVSPILKEMHELKEMIIKIFNQTHDWYMRVSKLGLMLGSQVHYWLTDRVSPIGQQMLSYCLKHHRCLSTLP